MPTPLYQRIAAILLEAPPNVEELFTRLAEPLTELWRQYGFAPGSRVKADTETGLLHVGYQDQAFMDAVNQHPLLSQYLTVNSNNTPGGGAAYRVKTGKLALSLHGGNLNTLLGGLRHELVHRAQHERAGEHFGYSRRHKELIQRSNNMYTAPNAAGVVYAKGNYSNADFNKAHNDKAKSYTEEPVEAQAFGVQTAGALKNQPDWRSRLRSGAVDTDGGRRYAQTNNGTPKGRNRMLKNAYQYLTQNEAVAAHVVNRLLDYEPT